MNAAQEQRITFKTDDQVIHTIFGEGIVCNTNQDVVEINFSGERKEMSAEAMIKANVIQKYKNVR